MLTLLKRVVTIAGDRKLKPEKSSKKIIIMEGFYVFGLVCLFNNERLITQTKSLKKSCILHFNPVKSQAIDCGRGVL